jgi:hypothetical protein
MSFPLRPPSVSSILAVPVAIHDPPTSGPLNAPRRVSARKRVFSYPDEDSGAEMTCPACEGGVILPGTIPARATPEGESDKEQFERRPRRRRSGAVGFICPYCHTDEIPTTREEYGATTWIVFVILLLFCFPLCVIALFITQSYRVCSQCGMRLGG